jgi:hypothetical protein
MEDGRRRQRVLQRRFECNRLEEQLWTRAYDEVCPVIRQSTRRGQERPQRRPRTDGKAAAAMRA